MHKSRRTGLSLKRSCKGRTIADARLHTLQRATARYIIIRLEEFPCIKLARSLLEHGREAHLLLMDVCLIKIDLSFILIP